MYPSPSSRWCPTPEQLMILEEMYRGGLRTPKAAQIQQITAHLSLYGKIEGKNVFYWFQNHKARERQKLRRKLMAKQLHHEKQNPNQQIFHPQLFYYIPVEVLPQGGIVNVSAQMMSHSQPMDPLPDDQRCEVEKPMARTDDRDWVMMLNVGQTTPSHCNKPLKTLELFPTTPTGLKDECTTRNQNPSSTPTKQP